MQIHGLTRNQPSELDTPMSIPGEFRRLSPADFLPWNYRATVERLWQRGFAVTAL
jgi:hypothetical protein